MPPIHRRRDVDPAGGRRRYGAVLFADPVNRKYPIDTPQRIKAAWAYIHTPSNRAKYTPAEVRTIERRIRAAAKLHEITLPDPRAHLDLLAKVRRHTRSKPDRA
jgi:hypothetical protein